MLPRRNVAPNPRRPHQRDPGNAHNPRRPHQRDAGNRTVVMAAVAVAVAVEAVAVVARAQRLLRR